MTMLIRVKCIFFERESNAFHFVVIYLRYYVILEDKIKHLVVTLHIVLTCIFIFGFEDFKQIQTPPSQYLHENSFCSANKIVGMFFLMKPNHSMCLDK